MKQTLGIRNNNPGNIRYTRGSRWKGLSGSNKGFCTFIDVRYGIRALFILLTRSYRNKGWDTIESIIKHYAPSVENDTRSYIRYVCEKTGLRADQPIEWGLYYGIMKAMCYYESLYQLTLEKYREAIEL